MTPAPSPEVARLDRIAQALQVRGVSHFTNNATRSPSELIGDVVRALRDATSRLDAAEHGMKAAHDLLATCERDRQSLSRQVKQLEADQFTIASNANRLNDEKNALSRQVERLREFRDDILAATDPSNWSEMTGDFYRGFYDAMVETILPIVTEALTDKGTETPTCTHPKCDCSVSVSEDFDTPLPETMCPKTVEASPSLPATPGPRPLYDAAGKPHDNTLTDADIASARRLARSLGRDLPWDEKLDGPAQGEPPSAHLMRQSAATFRENNPDPAQGGIREALIEAERTLVDAAQWIEAIMRRQQPNHIAAASSIAPRIAAALTTIRSALQQGEGKP